MINRLCRWGWDNLAEMSISDSVGAKHEHTAHTRPSSVTKVFHWTYAVSLLHTRQVHASTALTDQLYLHKHVSLQVAFYLLTYLFILELMLYKSYALCIRSATTTNENDQMRGCSLAACYFGYYWSNVFFPKENRANKPDLNSEVHAKASYSKKKANLPPTINHCAFHRYKHIVVVTCETNFWVFRIPPFIISQDRFIFNIQLELKRHQSCWGGLIYGFC